MLPRWRMALLVLLRERWSARRDAQIRFPKLQLEMAQSRLPSDRVIPDPVERKPPMKIGAELDHAVENTLGIVCIKTYRWWLREERIGRKPGEVGRPRMMKSLRELILPLAREDAGWGVRRIVGELQKLASRSSRSSVRRVLVEKSILPDPDRHAPKGVQTPWRKFIAICMDVMVACWIGFQGAGHCGSLVAGLHSLAAVQQAELDNYCGFGGADQTGEGAD